MKKRLLSFLLIILIILKTAPLTSMKITNNDNDDNDSTEIISSQNSIESNSQQQKNPFLSLYKHTYASYADKGCYRETMEDFYSNFSDHGFHGIYDGHGGDTFALLAQINLATYIFTHEDFEKKPHEALKEAFNRFNAKYFCIKESGTTATVLIFTDTSFWIANVGDSHAICSINGKAKQITENHHPSEQKEKERIEKLEIKNQESATFTRYYHNMLFPFIDSWENNCPIKKNRNIDSVTRMKYGLALSRALGDFIEHPYLTPEPFVQEITLNKSQEFIIIASDGLWDAISKQAAVDFVREKMNEINKDSSSITQKEAQKIVEELVKIALNCHDMDNVTATIIFLNNSEIK